MQLRLNDVLRYTIITGLFLLLLVPLFVSSSTFFPFIVGKNVAFRVIVEILLGLWVILALRDPESRPKWGPVLYSLCAWIVVASLATIFGENPYHSFWSNFERMEGLITYLHLFAYFLILITVLRSRKMWNIFFHGSLLVGLILAVHGFIQLGGGAVIHQGGVRLDASLGNATYLAVLMLFSFFIALLYALRSNVAWQRVAYSALGIVYLIILYNTATRGTILGVAFGLIVLAVILALRSSGNVRRAAIGALALIVVSAGLLFSIRDTDFVRDSQVLGRFASISIDDSSAQTRFTMWRLGFEGSREHPILGWGPGNFNIVFNEYYDPSLHSQETWFDHAHNTVIDWLVSAGWLGLLTYLSIYISAVLVLWRRTEMTVVAKSTLTALLVGHFVSNLFVFDNITSYIVFFAILGFVHQTSTEKAPSNRHPSAPVPLQALAAAVLVVLVVVTAYGANIKPMKASSGILQAFHGSSGGERSLTSRERIDLAKDLFRKGTYANGEAAEQVVVNAIQAAHNDSVPADLKQELFLLARDKIIEQAQRHDNNARTYVFLSNLLATFGDNDGALSAIERALELSPKKQRILFDKAAVLALANDVSAAIETLAEAYNLDHEYHEAAVRYAVALITAGRVDKGEEVLIERFGTPEYAEQRLVNAYLSQGRTSRVLGVWLGLVEKEPANLQHRLSFAATLNRLGRKDEAIAAIEEIIRIEPKFRDQGREFIRQIQEGV